MEQSINYSKLLEAEHGSGLYPKRSVLLVRGKGAKVWDAYGRVYIDCVGGHGVVLLGHSHPAVVAAVRAQAETLITCPGTFYNDKRAKLVSQLATIAPAD